MELTGLQDCNSRIMQSAHAEERPLASCTKKMLDVQLPPRYVRRLWDTGKGGNTTYQGGRLVDGEASG